MGFALLQERTERRGGDFRRLFLRRMTALLGIGLFHIFVLWHGDILTLYALMGFVLLLFRKATERALLVWTLVLLGMLCLFQLAMMGTGGALDPTPPFDALSRTIREAAGGPEATLFTLRSSDNPWQVFLGNLANAVQPPGRYLQTGRPAKVLAMFVLGLWVGRCLLPDPLVHRRLLARVLGGGLVLGLLGNSVFAWAEANTGKSPSRSRPSGSCRRSHTQWAWPRSPWPDGPDELPLPVGGGAPALLRLRVEPHPLGLLPSKSVSEKPESSRTFCRGPLSPRVQESANSRFGKRFKNVSTSKSRPDTFHVTIHIEALLIVGQHHARGLKLKGDRHPPAATAAAALEATGPQAPCMLTRAAPRESLAEGRWRTMPRMNPGPHARTQVHPARGRLFLLPLMLLVVALGLGSRSAAARGSLPSFLTAYAGDTLWASIVYLCLVFALPRLPVLLAAVGALGLSVLVELSQLVHTPWLDVLRAHRLGALVLGRGFLASDLICYAAGVALAVGVDLLLLSRRRPPMDSP